MSQRSSMLDLVRRTCDGAADMDGFEGVYEPDPEQVREWQEREPETYSGEFRFVNLPPQEIDRRIEQEDDPDELEALRLARSFWGGSSGIEAGYVDRGDEREAIYASSMKEISDNVSPQGQFESFGRLSTGGGSFSENGMGFDPGVIDWDMLIGMGPPPEPTSGDSWFQ